MNPYTPIDLIESCDRALAAWKRLTLEEKLAAFKRMGLVDEEGKLHPDYDWTPERYAREYGQAAK